MMNTDRLLRIIILASVLIILGSAILGSSILGAGSTGVQAASSLAAARRNPALLSSGQIAALKGPESLLLEPSINFTSYLPLIKQ